MTRETVCDWSRHYDDVIALLPSIAAAAPLTMCGMSACMDARVSMHDMRTLNGSRDPQFAAFSDMLVTRARQGIGGEIAVDWPNGPNWLAAHVPIRYSLGGTGPHAAWVLATLGARALLCLGDRSAPMLENVPRGILLAEGGHMATADALTPHGEGRPAIFIFEYTAGVAIGSMVPDRSSRIIVRFHNLGLEDDPDFDRLTPQLASAAGGGLLSGFNAVPARDLPGEIARVFGLARSWREAGLGLVHLEMAGYDSLALVDAVLNGARDVVTSIGMSHSELQILEGRETDTVAAMIRLGERLRCRRVCVHADHWAASVTKDDPAAERQALLFGCLLASARAAAGRPVRPVALDASARFAPLPLPETARQGAWRLVSCASPYIERPATTLGLGDTFTAGCLLALGQNRTTADQDLRGH